ncbi:MAG TPA: hypothetical protein P5191_01360 [Ruminococcus sp.]|nr:hypothetical protein [Ruminococcus sp.]
MPCSQWRETGEPKPIIHPLPVKPPAVPGLTETVEHYLERLRKWRIGCAKIIIAASIIFFIGAALYMKCDSPEPIFPIIIFAAALYFIAPRMFANSRPKPLVPPASEEIHVPSENTTWFSFILIDIAAGAAMFLTAVLFFGPFVWK